MSLIRTIVNYLVYSNVFIALCAVAMVMATEIWWRIPLKWDLLDLFVFCGTLTSYTLHRLVAFRNPNSQKREVVQWSLKRKGLFYTLFALGALGTAICFFLLEQDIQWFLVLFGFLTVFYSVPLFFTQKLGKFREFPGLKIFLIAFVWAGVTVLLPMVANDITIFNRAGQLFLLERALFIFLITLPFDIRDMKLDEKEQVATIPNTFGLKVTQWIAYTSIACLLLLNYFNLQIGQYPSYFCLLFSVFYLTIGGLVRYASPNRHELYCLFWIDGLMLVLFFCNLFLLP